MVNERLKCSKARGALPVRGYKQVEGNEEIRPLIRISDSRNAIREIIRFLYSLFLNLNCRVAYLSS
jgi:hypothetical protein